MRHLQQNLTASHLLSEARPTRTARAATLLGAVALFGFFSWASVTPVHEIVSGNGSILPTGFIQQVQHLEGGIVENLRVTTGDTVSKGSILAVLDPTASRAELDKAKARLETIRLTIDRLHDTASAEPSGTTEFLSELPGIAESQKAALASAIENRRARAGVIETDITLAEREIAGLEEQLVKSQLELDILTRQETEYEAAYEAGAISRQQFDAVKRDRLGLEAEVIKTGNAIEIARTKVARGQAQLVELQSQFKLESLDQIANLEAERAETIALIRQHSDRVRRLEIRSPVDGVVNSVSVRGAGEVLAPGQILADIVPVDREAFAEVEVPAERIGLLEPGMSAKIKVLTYDFVRYGGIEGTVDRIAPSSTARDDGKMFFTVRMKLARNHLGPQEAGFIVKPGMTVLADIKTGSKSILSYLIKPLRVISDRAMTES